MGCVLGRDFKVDLPRGVERRIKCLMGSISSGTRRRLAPSGMCRVFRSRCVGTGPVFDISRYRFGRRSKVITRTAVRRGKDGHGVANIKGKHLSTIDGTVGRCFSVRFRLTFCRRRSLAGKSSSETITCINIVSGGGHC